LTSPHTAAGGQMGQDMGTTNYWRDLIDEATARRILGDSHFDAAVEQGAIYCAGRRRGAWDANHAEFFAAYDCATRVADRKAARS
jgi:hypothetical protein